MYPHPVKTPKKTLKDNLTSYGQIRSPDALSSRTAKKLSKTQVNALEILQKEENNAKLSRLESLLIQQMIAKYGTKKFQSDVNKIIRAEITKFMNSYKISSSPIENDNALIQLEQIIKTETDKFKSKEKLNTNNTSFIDSMEANKSLKSSSKVFSNTGIINSEGTVTPSVLENTNGNTAGNVVTVGTTVGNSTFNTKDWKVFNAILDVNDEENEENEKKIIQQRRLKYKNDLESQIEQQKHVNLENQNEKIFWQKQINEQLQEFNHQVETSKQEKTKLILQEKEIKLQQIAEHKKRLEEERDAMKRYGQQEVLRAQRELQLQEEKKRQDREKQLKEKELFVAANERNKQIREEQANKEREHELKLQREYELRLQREEEARVAAFNHRVEQMKLAGLKYDKFAGEEIRRREKQEETRVASDVEKKDRENAEYEAKKAHDRQLYLQQSKEFNQNTIELRKQHREKEKRDDELYRLEKEKEAEAFKQEELRKKKEHKIKMQELSKTLDHQMETIHQLDESKTILSQAEMSINKVSLACNYDD